MAAKWIKSGWLIDWLIEESECDFSPVIYTVCSGVQRGDTVSVYIDVAGHCRKGLVKTFDGVKLHVGNGRAEVSRHDVFVNDNHIRWASDTLACVLFLHCH